MKSRWKRRETVGKPREGSEITVDAYGRRVSAEDERRRKSEE